MDRRHNGRVTILLCHPEARVNAGELELRYVTAIMRTEANVSTDHISRFYGLRDQRFRFRLGAVKCTYDSSWCFASDRVGVQTVRMNPEHKSLLQNSVP